MRRKMAALKALQVGGCWKPAYEPVRLVSDKLSPFREYVCGVWLWLCSAALASYVLVCCLQTSLLLLLLMMLMVLSGTSKDGWC